MLSPLLDVLTGPLPEDAARLFHGRGLCYEGLSFLNVDWFEPVVWAVVYGDVDDDLVASIAAALAAFGEHESRVQCVSLQRRGRGTASQEVIYGALPEVCFAREAGARYERNFSANQNVGFFLDVRPGRQWLRERAQGKRVLNLFSYTCSFSVVALQGGAAEVINIDMAKSALATGQRNHALNGLPPDVFRSTRNLEDLGPYDLVISDPPSRQKRSFEADKDYARLLQQLAPMLAPGAEILACLNAPYLGAAFLPELFEAHLKSCEYVEHLPQREDFPEKDLDCCLKMQAFRQR
ncbi:S-adenosylmethionine-dependent methyltransferase [Halioglobus japonicus]|nr:class I SAM-dependent methyltransferase [Halioglobus japonicus]GHD16663.1 S-adenosylmethionine-dependent methyltransferase [Halioglobus japonicus]